MNTNLLQGSAKIPKYTGGGELIGHMIYSGGWKEGKWSGWGDLIYPDGVTYCGEGKLSVMHCLKHCCIK